MIEGLMCARRAVQKGMIHSGNSFIRVADRGARRRPLHLSSFVYKASLPSLQNIQLSPRWLTSSSSSSSTSTTTTTAATTATSSNAATKRPVNNEGKLTTTVNATILEPLPLPRFYRYLRLETFRADELSNVFDKILEKQENNNNNYNNSSINRSIEASHIQDYLLERIKEMEKESELEHYYTVDQEGTDQRRLEFAKMETDRFLQVFQDDGKKPKDVSTSLSKTRFIETIQEKASRLDLARTWPITVSMLLVGSSVGVITPAMPFVVEQLGITPGQYGLVVSAFALAKMAGNIPSAIAVERHGRKPYLTYSHVLVAIGVGGIGLAGSFEELYLCRLLTGVGVAALSTAGTMMITDLSTPLNRASTMAPIMSAFAAGTALGPALGGILVDSIGLHQTFYLVGVSYLGVALLNRAILTETKGYPIHFAWQQKRILTSDDKKGTLRNAVQDAVGQWVPLMKDPCVRNIMFMNSLYWMALAGAQMTLLPLILTDSAGLAMTATQVGQVYMGMSLIQIVGNPLFARFADSIGKAPAIVGGCALITTAMTGLPFCENVTELAGALGLWSMGSSMLSTAPVAYVSDRVDESKRAQAIALLRTCGDVGFLIGASGSGVLADWTGSLHTAMHFSAGLLATATTWFGTRQFLIHQNEKATKCEP